MGTEDDFWCLKGNWWPKVNNLEIQIKELGIRDGGFWTPRCGWSDSRGLLNKNTCRNDPKMSNSWVTKLFVDCKRHEDEFASHVY